MSSVTVPIQAQGDYPQTRAAGSPTRRSLARSAFHLLVGQVLTTVFALLVTGAIGRTLGPTDFGGWYLLTTIATFAVVFVDWGYAPHLTREIARDQTRIGELTGTVVAIRAVTALVIAGPVVVVTWLLGYAAPTPLLAGFLIVASIPTFLTISYCWVFRGSERMDLEAMLLVVVKAFTYVLTIAFFAVGARIGGMIAAQGVAGVASTALAIQLYRRQRLGALRANWEIARELIRTGAPTFTMAVAVSIQPYANAHILAAMVPPIAVGWYGAAAALSGTLLAPAMILGGAVFPRLSRATDSDSEFKRLVRASMRPLLLVAVLGGVGTYLFADVAIDIVYHDANFHPAADTLRAFAPTLLVGSVGIFLSAAVFVVGRIQEFARVKVAALAVTGVLDLLLIPTFQSAFGNGGIGVMLAVGAGELMLVAYAWRLLPAGLLDKALGTTVLKVTLAGAGTLVIGRFAAAWSPVAAIPFAIAVYAAFCASLGLVARRDIDYLRTAFASPPRP